MTRPARQLLFVYNADGDLFSQLTDFAHKILSPKTYECPLCQLTHGNFTIKSRWRDFLKELPYPKTFLHRDNFVQNFPDANTVILPAIFLVADNHLSPVMTAEELKTLKDLDELISLLQKKIATL